MRAFSSRCEEGIIQIRCPKKILPTVKIPKMFFFGFMNYKYQIKWINVINLFGRFWLVEAVIKRQQVSRKTSDKIVIQMKWFFFFFFWEEQVFVGDEFLKGSSANLSHVYSIK